MRFVEKTAVDARIGSITPAVQGGRWRAVAIPGSAAALAGLRTGDELIRINGNDIVDGSDVSSTVRSMSAGRPVRIDVVRDGQPVTIRFTAATYQEMDAELTDVAEQTERMRRIRSGLLTGK